MVRKDLKIESIVQAIIFSSDTPVSEEKLLSILGEDFDNISVDEIVATINQNYQSNSCPFKIEKISQGYMMTTRSEYDPFIQKFCTEKNKNRLSKSGMECLAIISVKQPITRVEIEKIRGVNSSGSLNTLIEKELIAIRGRKKVAGNPVLYCTTDTFLKKMGLEKIEDLPDYYQIKAFIKAQEEKKLTEEQIRHEMQA